MFFHYYPKRGLRTLVVGYRKIERNQYIAQREALEAAKQQVGSATRRESEMSRTYKLIEDNLHLLGATGVEDRLQDGVPETLEALRAAGIKVNIEFIVLFYFKIFQSLELN